jgi:hypothetical protein
LIILPDLPSKGKQFEKDILNVLRATYVASEGSAALALDVLCDRTLQATVDAAGVPIGGQALDKELLQMYRRGFCTALSSVALAFGLAPVTQEPRGPGHLDFCWTDVQGGSR